MAAVLPQAVAVSSPRDRGAIEGRYDLWLLGTAVVLIGLGLVMVASASVAIADRQTADPLYYFWRQLFYVCAGAALAVMAVRLPVRAWQKAGPVLLLACALLLVLVLVPGVGREVNGSMRWFRLGPLSLQPSELMKVLMCVYLAGYLVRHGAELRTAFSGFIKPLGVMTGVAGLLLLEPDYGTTVVLFATVLGMLYLGGVPQVRFWGWVMAAGALMVVFVLKAPYRVQRLATFMDPWADPFDKGFQLTQALIAIGRGEWLGVGLGASVQKLFYLPEAHTDFLFAVLAEELGIAGMLVVIGLFSLLVWRGFRIAGRAERRGQMFGAYLAYGLVLVIGLQALVNIGVNLGALPTKGLTLPLMSYGGSSMVASCLALGMLLRIDRESRGG
jgi:cell division protein FtsW